MRARWFWISIAVVCFLTLGIAQNGDDLPAAPSASIQKKKAPPPPAPAVPPPTGQADSATDSAQQADTRNQTAPQDEAGPPPAGTDADSDTRVTSERPTIYTSVNEVNVVFTVTDKHNRYIKDLARSDFRVIDDAKPVDRIRSFRRETDLPLQVGLLIDASNSIRDRFKFEQESAIEFLNQTIRPKFDRAFVIGFDTQAEVTQDFTDNTELLSRGVRALRPGGGTAMYDALYRACREKLLKSAQLGSVRRAIILVSDGDDNYSHATRDEAIEMALRSNVIVYTISTNFPSGGKGDQVLQKIAESTGGRAFEPFQLNDVANAFAQIQADLRSQYALSYSPADFRHDGRYRTIEITALNHKGLKVRSRHGYYAPGE
jgi:VWFA-related protein